MRKKTSLMAIGMLAAGSCGAEAENGAKGLAISAADSELAWSACPPIFPAGCEIAVLRGDPAGPNADVFLRTPAHYAIPPHWHTSAERMILVTGVLDVRYEAQPAARLEAGDYAYGPAKLPHEARCVSDDPCTLFIAFEEAVDAHAVDSVKGEGDDAGN